MSYNKIAQLKFTFTIRKKKRKTIDFVPPVEGCCLSIVWVAGGEGGWGQVANCRPWSRKYFVVFLWKYRVVLLWKYCAVFLWNYWAHNNFPRNVGPKVSPRRRLVKLTCASQANIGPKTTSQI